MNPFARIFHRKPAEERQELKAEQELDKRRLADRMQISEALKARLNEMGPQHADQAMMPLNPRNPVRPYTPPAGVCPASHVLAMDAQLDAVYNNRSSGVLFSGMGFPGFPYLTELSQVTEYRDMSERVAAEMTRKWIKFRSTSEEDDKSEDIAKVEATFKRLKVREIFRQAAETDGLMGRAQIFIDLGEHEGPELRTPLMLNQFKITKGSLRGLKLIEPITTYPYQYNSSNPLRQDFYKPAVWYIFGQAVHDTRLLTFVARPLPNLLKPVYNFSGMSLSQLAEPYVKYWLNTRDSVGNLLRNFSTTVLSTDMNAVLQGTSNGSEVLDRARVFTQVRDNQGLFMLDKDHEELIQINTPLSGLDKLEAQAQEHMAAVAKTPLVVLLGITPTGLNASAEGEVRVFYDYVADMQEKLFRANLEKLLRIVMLSELGHEDEDITFDFEPLFALTGKERAEIRKTDGATDVGYIQMGVLAPLEVRKKLAGDPDSGYDGLEVDELPSKPAVEGETSAPDDTQNAPSPQGGDPGLGKAPDALEVKAADAAVAGAHQLLTDAIEANRSWFGNQHTGPIGTRGEHPSATASKLSGFAKKATIAAQRAGTRTAHRHAARAHERALEAHKTALELADSDHGRIVHQSFVDAHTAGSTAHRSHLAKEGE